MIETMILLGVFDCHHVSDILHHTDGRPVTTRVVTDGTSHCIAEVMTCLTEMYLLLKLIDRGSECLHCLLVLSEQEEGEAQRCLPADARQDGKLRHDLI